MLSDIGLIFDVIPSTIDERSIDKLNAIEIAKAKALNVSHQFPNHWVIGADQVCHLNGEVFHKPLSIKNAINTLQKLQGKTHTLLTAACIAHNNIIVWEGLDEVQLTMKPLSSSEIFMYITTEQPLQSCGAYTYEGHGNHLFSHVTHPAESIQGLPMVKLKAALSKHLSKPQ